MPRSSISSKEVDQVFIKEAPVGKRPEEVMDIYVCAGQLDYKVCNGEIFEYKASLRKDAPEVSLAMTDHVAGNKRFAVYYGSIACRWLALPQDPKGDISDSDYCNEECTKLDIP